MDIDSISSTPTGGKFKKWFAGIFVPLFPIIYGVISCFTSTTVLPFKRKTIELHGPEAICLSIIYITLGAYIHFHYYWGLDDHLYLRSLTMKRLTLCVALPILGFMIFLLLNK